MSESLQLTVFALGNHKTSTGTNKMRIFKDKRERDTEKERHAEKERYIEKERQTHTHIETEKERDTNDSYISFLSIFILLFQSN